MQKNNQARQIWVTCWQTSHLCHLSLLRYVFNTATSTLLCSSTVNHYIPLSSFSFPPCCTDITNPPPKKKTNKPTNPSIFPSPLFLEFHLWCYFASQLPGVDPNDPSVKDLLASMQSQSQVSLFMVSFWKWMAYKLYFKVVMHIACWLIWFLWKFYDSRFSIAN